MINSSQGHAIRTGCLGLLLAILLCSPVSAQAVDVLVNRDNVVQKIPLSELRSVFTMRQRRWPDGTPVRVVVLPDHHPAHVVFCREVLRSYPYQLRRIWQRLVFSGTGIGPRTVEDESAMLEMLAKTPGAIGYVAAAQDIPDGAVTVEIED